METVPGVSDKFLQVSKYGPTHKHFIEKTINNIECL